MTNNYLKILGPSIAQYVFFDDTNPDRAAAALVNAEALVCAHNSNVPEFRGKASLSVFRSAPGFRSINLIGEPTGDPT